MIEMDTEKELADAKANRVRGYAQEFETMGQLVRQIAQLWSLGLPMSEFQRVPDETGRVTLTAVNAVAQKYAVPGVVGIASYPHTLSNSSSRERTASRCSIKKRSS